MACVHPSDSVDSPYMCGGCGEQKDLQFRFCLCDAAGGGAPVILTSAIRGQIKSILESSALTIKDRLISEYDVLRDAHDYTTPPCVII